MTGVLTARLAILAAILFWGVSFVATKAVLREISPITLIFVRFVLGTGFLLGLGAVRGAHPVPPRGTWPALALMGFVGVFVHQLIQVFGLTTATAVHAGWLMGLIPIWSAVLSAIVLKERFGGLKIAGLAGGFAGALLVITQGRLTAETLRLPSTGGDMLVLLSSVNWAVYSVLGHSTIKQLGSLRATGGMMLFGTVMVAPLFVWNRGWQELPQLSAVGWLSLSFLGFGCSALGYLFWYGGLARLEVSRVASFLYLQPFVTLVAAMILLNEPVRALTVAGGLLVLLSVFVLQRAGEETQ